MAFGIRRRASQKSLIISIRRAGEIESMIVCARDETGVVGTGEGMVKKLAQVTRRKKKKKRGF